MPPDASDRLRRISPSTQLRASPSTSFLAQLETPLRTLDAVTHAKPGGLPRVSPVGSRRAGRTHRVETGGIEPPLRHCERRVLPLNYVPNWDRDYSLPSADFQHFPRGKHASPRAGPSTAPAIPDHYPASIPVGDSLARGRAGSRRGKLLAIGASGDENVRPRSVQTYALEIYDFRSTATRLGARDSHA